MPKPADVIIVGGGPAGSSAATHLASMGYAVQLLEKERMPRDKLCGEFLSMDGAEACRKLGVLGRLRSAGAREIRRVRMSSGSGRIFETTLPTSALGISRRTLDQVLFDRAAESGARVLEGCTVRSIKGRLGDGFRIQTDDRTFSARVVLGAFGRRNRLDNDLRIARRRDRSPYVAFKAHFTGLDLSDAIELHAFPGGYCGVLSEDHGQINACWISHRRVLKDAGGKPDMMVGRMMKENRVLTDLFASLERVGAYSASSQLVFRRQTLFSGDVCLIGDAAGMIAPLCGDGMAMALSNAELASSLVHDLIRGRIDPPAFRSVYARSWPRQFRKRMLLGRLLHAGYVRPAVSDLGIRIAEHLPTLAQALVRATRG